MLSYSYLGKLIIRVRYYHEISKFYEYYQKRQKYFALPFVNFVDFIDVLLLIQESNTKFFF